ncbi:MAG: hypothetical protein AABX98_02545 [Nanoarchaeota archaeon]
MSNTTLYVDYMKTVKETPVTISNTTIGLGFAIITVLIVVL